MGTWKNKELTGERRHRQGMFGKLILQVREHAIFEGDRMGPYGDRQPMHGLSGTRWRDATIEDLTRETPPCDTKEKENEDGQK